MRNLQATMFYADKGPIRDYIPTYGLPCSAIDLFRVSDFITDDFSKGNPGFSIYKDYNNISIFENEITSFNDILKFETSLRFLLLIDNLYFLHPSIKYLNKDSGLQSYLRPENFSSDSANFIYHSIGAFDFLFPSEKLVIEKNKVILSSDSKSKFINLEMIDIKEQLKHNEQIDNTLQSIPSRISTPFTSSNSESSINDNIIIKEYLKSLDENFNSNIKFSLKFGYNIPLPFFTNSVLSIAKNRDDIPNAIIKLRNDLLGLREQLFNYQDKLKGIDSVHDQSILQRDIQSAIKTYTKDIYRGDNLVSDSIRLIVELVKNPADLFIKNINPNYNMNNEFPIIFGNSNFKRLRNLISKDNINTNIYNFLTEQEIKNISA